MRPVRVAESPVALECGLHAAITLGDSTVVMGRVVHASIAEEVWADDGRLPAIERLRPLARLGRDQWSSIGEVHSIRRIPFGEWPGHYSPPTA